MCDAARRGYRRRALRLRQRPQGLELEGDRRRVLPAVQFHPDFTDETGRRRQSVQSDEDLIEVAQDRVHALYDSREPEFTAPVMRQIEKIVMLQTLDSLWKDHLLAMDHLKEGIGLRGYAQHNPLVEYQKEGFSMFEALMSVMQKDVVEKMLLGPGAPGAGRASRSSSSPAAEGGDEPRRRVRAGSGRNPPNARPTRSAATIPARAARARSTNAATASDAAGSPRRHPERSEGSPRSGGSFRTIHRFH